MRQRSWWTTMTWSDTKLTWESRTEQEAKPRGLSHLARALDWRTLTYWSRCRPECIVIQSLSHGSGSLFLTLGLCQTDRIVYLLLVLLLCSLYCTVCCTPVESWTSDNFIQLHSPANYTLYEPLLALSERVDLWHIASTSLLPVLQH